MIIDEDAVLQGGDPYPEEAIPLVIFNEEKKCRFFYKFIADRIFIGFMLLQYSN